MQASSSDNQAHPAGLVDVHCDTGTSDKWKVCHDIESYIALCTVADPDSVTATSTVVPENRQLRHQKLRFQRLMVFQKNLGFDFGYRNNSTRHTAVLRH